MASRWSPLGVPPTPKTISSTINYLHRGGVLLEYLQYKKEQSTQLIIGIEVGSFWSTSNAQPDLDMKWVMSRWSPFRVPPTSKSNNIYIFVDYIGIEVESISEFILEYFQHHIIKQKHHKNTKKQTKIEFILNSTLTKIDEKKCNNWYRKTKISSVNIHISFTKSKNLCLESKNISWDKFLLSTRLLGLFIIITKGILSKNVIILWLLIFYNNRNCSSCSIS